MKLKPSTMSVRSAVLLTSAMETPQSLSFSICEHFSHSCRPPGLRISSLMRCRAPLVFVFLSPLSFHIARNCSLVRESNHLMKSSGGWPPFLQLGTCAARAVSVQAWRGALGAGGGSVSPLAAAAAFFFWCASSRSRALRARVTMTTGSGDLGMPQSSSTDAPSAPHEGVAGQHVAHALQLGDRLLQGRLGERQRLVLALQALLQA